MAYVSRRQVFPELTQGSAGSPARTAPANDAVRRKFCSVFEIRTANSLELLNEAFRLRYQVYCVENPFENPAEHSDGREIDEFDPHSAHTVLIHRGTAKTVGSVRLVLPRSDALHQSFPIQKTCKDPFIENPRLFPLETMGELSRFALSKEFRRRSTDTAYGDGCENAATVERDERRSTPPMRLGLMQGIVRMSVEAGLTHWCAVMEPALIRILRSTGIYFEPIGPLVNFHGLRQPCYGNIREILIRLRREQPQIWDLVTDGGELWDMLCATHPPASVPVAPVAAA